MYKIYSKDNSSFQILNLLLFFFLPLEPIQCFSFPPPLHLRCEYFTANDQLYPVVIDIEAPRFSWILSEETEFRNVSQVAYNLLVWQMNDQTQNLELVWNSKRINSSEQSHIEYQNPNHKLQNDRKYAFQVKVWVEGQLIPSSTVSNLLIETNFSDLFFFYTGYVLYPTSSTKTLSSFSSSNLFWIQGLGQFRKEININFSFTRASAFVSGLGWFEFNINGNKVGNNVLDPGWTRYSKKFLYSFFDITSYLKFGLNALAVQLGNGHFSNNWFKGDPLQTKLWLHINLYCKNGSVIQFTTDSTWKTQLGPIQDASVYSGEIYDASKETLGWDLPNYDDSSWKFCTQASAPGGVARVQSFPPIQVIEMILPMKITQPMQNTYVVDFGQNYSGWVKVHLQKASSQTKIELRYAELLFPNGTVNQINLGFANQTDIFIGSDKTNLQWYEPKFTYHGFRYVQISGLSYIPSLSDFQGKLVHSNVTMNGRLGFSDFILTSIAHNTWWSQKSNLFSIPTDCPQRDERLGWLGDAHVSSEEAIYNFDMGAFYTNWIDNIVSDQGSNGNIPDFVPDCDPFNFPQIICDHNWTRPADPSWGTALIHTIFSMVESYGDKRIIQNYFDSMQNYFTNLSSLADPKTNLVTFGDIGDWYAIFKCDTTLVSAFYYHEDALLLYEYAKLIGKENEAKKYKALEQSIRANYNKFFFNASSGFYTTSSPGQQTANTLPLYKKRIVDPKYLELATSALVASIEKGQELNGSFYYPKHITTGIIGATHLLATLSELGRTDLAFEIVSQKTFPGWGYMIENGATSLWEHWQNEYEPTESSSHNHIMFGAIGAWFYKNLIGIQAEEIGYSTVRIEPQISKVPLLYASAETFTIKGLVKSQWIKNSMEDSLNFTAFIPPNTRAHILIPKLSISSANLVIYESNSIVWKHNTFIANSSVGVISGRETKNGIEFFTGSGKFNFHFGDHKLEFQCGELKSIIYRQTNQSLVLQCPSSNQRISNIDFASFGLPVGTCGYYSYHQCHSNSTQIMIETICFGKPSCEIKYSDYSTLVKNLPCEQVFPLNRLKLFVQVTCST